MKETKDNNKNEEQFCEPIPIDLASYILSIKTLVKKSIHTTNNNKETRQRDAFILFLLHTKLIHSCFFFILVNVVLSEFWIENRIGVRPKTK